MTPLYNYEYKLDLEKLLKETKSKAIFLLTEDGEAVDFYPKGEKLSELQKKITVFETTLYNMSNHFFSTYLNANLKEIVLKSDGENILLIKCNEYILCFLSEKSINTSLLELVLKKELNH